MADPAAPTSPPALPRWRRVLRRAGLAAAGLLILLAVVFFLLPVWISNEQGRTYILDRMNARLHGPRVSIDHWSLGWFRSTELTNLRIVDSDGTAILACPHVSTGLTLWDLLWSNYDLRRTTLDNLELRVAKNPDGTTSLDAFTHGAGGILRSARGALQINAGQLTLVSVRTGENLRYSDVKATIAIASPDVPFHLNVTATGPSDASFTLTGTFPPTASFSAASFSHPGIWPVVGDMEISAGELPTALLCDYLELDPAWGDSLGSTLETAHYLSAPVTPAVNTCQVSLDIKGKARPGADPASIAGKILLKLPGSDGRGAVLAASGAGCDASLRYSEPLARLLARLNPILGEAAPLADAGAPGDPLVRARGTFSLPLDQPSHAEATVRVVFPPLTFSPRNGPSVLRQLLVFAGEFPRGGYPARLEGSAGLLRTTLADGQFAYENFLVTLAGTTSQRMNFTGTVGLDGKLRLLTTIPQSSQGISAGNLQLAITGTLDAPLVQRAE